MLRRILKTSALVFACLCMWGCEGCGEDPVDDNNGEPDAVADADTTDAADTIDDVDDAGDVERDGDEVGDAGDADDTGDAGDGISAVEQFALDWERTYCEAVWECSSGTTRELADQRWGRFDSKQDCMDSAPRLADLNERLEPLINAVEDGRLGFNESEAAGCLQNVESRLCSGAGVELAFRSQFAACPDVFDGREVQRFCISDAECGEGLYCDFSTVDGCGGRCDLVNDDCTGGAPCEAPGEACASALVCEPYASEGDTCGPVGGIADCAPSLVCDETPLPDASPRCIEAGSKAAGEECIQDAECEQGHSCQSSGGDQSTCQAVTLQGENEPCGGTAIFCGPGLFCSTVSGEDVCVPVRAEDTPCDSTEQCQFPNGCRFADGAQRCRPPLSAGEDCSDDAECQTTACSPADGCVAEEACEAPSR
jgi:hypothetical protein